MLLWSLRNTVWFFNIYRWKVLWRTRAGALQFHLVRLPQTPLQPQLCFLVTLWRRNLHSVSWSTAVRSPLAQRWFLPWRPFMEWRCKFARWAAAITSSATAWPWKGNSCRNCWTLGTGIKSPSGSSTCRACLREYVWLWKRTGLKQVGVPRRGDALVCSSLALAPLALCIILDGKQIENLYFSLCRNITLIRSPAEH